MNGADGVCAVNGNTAERRCRLGATLRAGSCSTTGATQVPESRAIRVPTGGEKQRPGGN
jgi:hypothetical protein